MKKILFIFLTLFVFSGCVYVNHTKDFTLLEANNFNFNEYKVKTSIYEYSFRFFMQLGFFDPSISKYFPGGIVIYAYGFDNINDIKINSYTIKKNNKEIKKKLKFKKNFYYYENKENNKNPLVLLYSKNSIHCKNEDLLELIFDLSINIDGEIINKIISSKWKVKEKFKFSPFVFIPR